MLKVYYPPLPEPRTQPMTDLQEQWAAFVAAELSGWEFEPFPPEHSEYFEGVGVIGVHSLGEAIEFEVYIQNDPPTALFLEEVREGAVFMLLPFSHREPTPNHASIFRSALRRFRPNSPLLTDPAKPPPVPPCGMFRTPERITTVERIPNADDPK